MGNSPSSHTSNVYTSDTTTSTKVIAEIGIQTDIIIAEPIELCTINIILPEYAYTYSGLLKDAPHIINKMTDMQWAKHMELHYSKRKNTCKWVINRKKSRESHIQIYINSTSNCISSPVHGSPVQAIHAWTQPQIPGCGSKICSNKSNNSDPRWQQPVCPPICYYKYISDVEEHYKTCLHCNS